MRVLHSHVRDLDWQAELSHDDRLGGSRLTCIQEVQAVVMSGAYHTQDATTFVGHAGNKGRKRASERGVKERTVSAGNARIGV